jgi:hypothetical protein
MVRLLRAAAHPAQARWRRPPMGGSAHACSSMRWSWGPSPALRAGSRREPARTLQSLAWSLSIPISMSPHLGGRCPSPATASRFSSLLLARAAACRLVGRLAWDASKPAKGWSVRRRCPVARTDGRPACPRTACPSGAGWRGVWDMVEEPPHSCLTMHGRRVWAWRPSADTASQVGRPCGARDAEGSGMASHAARRCAREAPRTSNRGAQGWAAPVPNPTFDLCALPCCPAAHGRMRGVWQAGTPQTALQATLPGAAARRGCAHQSPPMADGGGRAVPTLPLPPLWAAPSWLPWPSLSGAAQLAGSAAMQPPMWRPARRRCDRAVAGSEAREPSAAGRR